MQTQFPVEFNGYLYFILGLMVAGYLLDLIADTLNAAHLKPELPAEFQGLYDPQKYRTSIEYQKESIRFNTFQKTFWLALTLAFILMGGFDRVDHLARHWGHGGIVTGL